MTRSFGGRVGALVGVLLAGITVVGLSTPASAQTGSLRFNAACNQNIVSGFADVPAGTNVDGVGVVGAQTAVATPNTIVTFPISGNQAILNETIVVGGVTTRRAIRFISGPNAGVIVGEVTCGPTTSAASALVGSPITVNCPGPASVSSHPGGVATVTNVTVGNPAGAACRALGNFADASTSGIYSVNPYPLAVDVSGASGAAPALATPASSDNGGPSSSLLLLAGAGALSLVILGQVTIGRRMRRGDATN